MTSFVHVPSSIGVDFLGFSYRLGSDYEPEGKLGTSHLMEHLMCKSFDDMLPKLKRLGIAYNAATYTDRIIFYFQGLDESLAGVAQELLSRVTSGSFTWTQEAFENERQTVLQEYEDVYNYQLSGATHNWMRKYYRYYGPIGLRSDIEAFTYEESLKARKLFREPYMICQVGRQNITPTQDPDFDSLYKIPKSFGSYNVELEKVPREGKVVVGQISQKPIEKAYTNQVELLLTCLNDGIESPLSQEIRDLRGLSYASYGWLHEMSDTGVVSFCAATSKKNRKALRKVYRDFFNGDLSRHITQERFTDCYQSVMIQKTMDERLPHSGAMNTVLLDNPYTGLDDFTYEKAIGLLNEHFKADNFEEVEY